MLTPMTHRTIRYRIRANPATYDKLHGTAGACRFVWNWAVGKLQEDYKRDGKCEFSFYSLGKEFTKLRFETEWIRGYSANIVKGCLQPIYANYRQFFKGQGGLPRFKGKYDTVPSFPLSESSLFKIDGERLYIQRVGWVRINGNNPHGGKAVSGQVKCERGKWYAYIVYEVEEQLNTAPNATGIDRNVGQITLANGVIFETPDVSLLEARKRRYQRMVSRRQRTTITLDDGRKVRQNSNRRERARAMLQKTCAKIACIRKNWAHKTTRMVSDRYGLVFLENLKTQAMTAKGKRGLNREIRNTGWGMLEQMLAYKTRVEKVPPHYTSQKCNECGHTAKENRKSQSAFKCLECGHESNADSNAAKNILASGLGAVGQGAGSVSWAMNCQKEHGGLVSTCL